MITRRMAILRVLVTAFAGFAGGFALVACTPPAPERDYRADAIERGRAAVDACRASACTRLDLDGNILEDYAILADMTHVTALMMSNTNISDLSVIAPMTQLTELHIAGTPITDLQPLSNFPNLRLLHARDLPDGTDLAPIGRVTTLTELAAGGYDTTDLSFLSGLDRLERLNINYSPAISAEPLRDLRALRTLDVTGVPNVSTELLLSLPNLREVTLEELFNEPERQAQRDRLAARGITVLVTPSIVAC